MSLLGDSEGLDQTAYLCRLIWAFTIRICQKTCFRMAVPITFNFFSGGEDRMGEQGDERNMFHVLVQQVQTLLSDMATAKLRQT